MSVDQLICRREVFNCHNLRPKNFVLYPLYLPPMVYDWGISVVLDQYLNCRAMGCRAIIIYHNRKSVVPVGSCHAFRDE